MVKYSVIKKKLNVELTKGEQLDLAHLTHYLQNQGTGAGEYFVNGALDYVSHLIGNPNIKEPYFQGYLPIKWECPISTTKRSEIHFH